MNRKHFKGIINAQFIRSFEHAIIYNIRKCAYLIFLMYIVPEYHNINTFITIFISPNQSIRSYDFDDKKKF